MKDHRPGRHQAEELPHFDAGQSHLCFEQLAPYPTLNPHQHGRSHCPEGDGGALDHHPDHDCRGSRKAHGHHQRSADSRRSAEPRRPLDEGAEEPAQEHDLDSSIVADCME